MRGFEATCCFRVKREHPERFPGLIPEGQAQNLALAVLYVLDSLDSGASKSEGCESFQVMSTRTQVVMSLITYGSDGGHGTAANLC